MSTLKRRIQQTGTGILLALNLMLAACSNELQTPAPTAPDTEDRVVTLTAKIGKTGAQTRIDFTDEGTGGVKTTWSEGDRIMVYGVNESGEYSRGSIFTLQGNGGSDSGEFVGVLPEGETAATYEAWYPADKMPEVMPENEPFLSMLNQTQTGNGDMKHLSDYNYIVAYTDDTKMTLNFEACTALLTFDLTLPNCNGNPCRLDLMCTENSFLSSSTKGGTGIYCMSLGLKDISLTDGKLLKAYMMLCSESIGAGESLTITVTTDNGKIYSHTWTNTSGSLIRYESGYCYTATIGADKWNDISAKTVSTTTSPALSFGGGDGSVGNPYVISSAAELLYLRDLVNAGYSYSGQYFKLTTDFYVTTDTWTPIGLTYNLSFKGNFDGGGHTIYGKLHASASSSNENRCFGFFGATADNIIQNLNMNAEVKGGNTATNYYYTGSVTGYGTDTTLDNCHNYGKVTGGNTTASSYISYTGGIAGNTKKITNCSNHGEVTGGKGNDCYTGGIAGGTTTINGYTITNCVNDGKITAGVATGTYNSTGGIAGSSYSLSDCTNYGEVISPDTEQGFSLGGIIGYLNDGNTMHTCLNMGTIQKATSSYSVRYGGGLVGYNAGTLYSCNTHAGIVVEADKSPAAGNPKAGYTSTYTGTTPDCDNVPPHTPR